MSYEEKVALNRQARMHGRGLDQTQSSMHPVANVLTTHRDLWQFAPKPGWIGSTAPTGGGARGLPHHHRFPPIPRFGGRTDLKGGILPDAFYNAWMDVAEHVAAPVIGIADKIV